MGYGHGHEWLWATNGVGVEVVRVGDQWQNLSLGKTVLGETLSFSLDKRDVLMM